MTKKMKTINKETLEKQLQSIRKQRSILVERMKSLQVDDYKLQGAEENILLNLYTLKDK
jgi:chaperonin cofactor prefoldin